MNQDTTSAATMRRMIFEMFDGPASQKFFASIWLLTLVGCVLGEVLVIYLASGHHL